MLLDERNYKAPPAIAQPSVAGFKAWLEQQSRETAYQYFGLHQCNCAVEQYLKTLGTSWVRLNDRRPSLLRRLDDFAFDAAATAKDNGFATFGDVLDEINKAGAA